MANVISLQRLLNPTKYEMQGIMGCDGGAYVGPSKRIDSCLLLLVASLLVGCLAALGPVLSGDVA